MGLVMKMVPCQSDPEMFLDLYLPDSLVLQFDQLLSKHCMSGSTSEYFYWPYGTWCATISKSSPVALFGSKEEHPWQSWYSAVQKHQNTEYWLHWRDKANKIKVTISSVICFLDLYQSTCNPNLPKSGYKTCQFALFVP